MAQSSEPPEALYDAGDFYLLRDRSVVPLLRSAREIAVKRAKALPQQELLRATSAERVLTSFDAYGSPTTHQIEQFTVKDPTKAREGLAAFEGVVWVSPVLATADTGKRVLLSDEIIVQFDVDMATDEMVEKILEDLAARGIEVARPPLPSSPGQYLLRSLHPDAEITLAEAAALFQQPGVAWAEPNFLVEVEMYAIPNDPLFAWQQGLRNTGQNGALAGADIRAADAWDIRVGNQRLVIAIIDTGVDMGHPDLQIFRNDAEWGNGRESNGVDNDGNGYIDDYQGWDFWDNDNDPNPGASASAGHGTACAGVAAARGNNGLGLAGAAWYARVLPVKIHPDSGLWPEPLPPIALDAIAQSIRYSAQYADVISCSWGVSTPSSAINSAIDHAAFSGRQGRGCPVFIASGNSMGFWEVKTLRVPCTITQTGTYKFGFRAQATGQISNSAILSIDQVRVLATNGYTGLWRDNLESGVTQWTVAKADGMNSDWALKTVQYYDPQLWPGSTYSFVSPNFNGKGADAWAELRTPGIWLPQGTIFISFMDMLFSASANLPLYGQIWLMDINGQPLLKLDDSVWGRNQYQPPVSYPASYVNSISVGACTDLGKRSFYSQYSRLPPAPRELFCVAPSHGGWNMMVTTDTRGTAGANDGTWSNGDYRLDFGGTSAATPLTAGVAALVFSKNANLSREQLMTALQAGCDRIGGVDYTGSPPWNQEYGYGRINAYNSLNLAAADTTPPTVTSVMTKTSRAVEVTFSEQMGTGVTSPTLYTISGSGKGTLATKPVSVAWVSGNTFLLEWTAGEMMAGTGNITITVGTAVRDIAGNGMGTPRTGNANGSRVIHAVSCGKRAPAALPLAPFESDRYWSGAGGPQEGDGVIQFLNDDGTSIGVVSTYRGFFGSYTSPGDIVYTLPGISSGVYHEMRLYFYNSGQCFYPGDIKFDIYINNVLKYSNLDLVLESGGSFNAFWKSFSNITASGGSIAVRIVPKLTFSQTWGYNCYSATLSGIKVTAQ